MLSILIFCKPCASTGDELICKKLQEFLASFFLGGYKELERAAWHDFPPLEIINPNTLMTVTIFSLAGKTEEHRGPML